MTTSLLLLNDGVSYLLLTNGVDRLILSTTDDGVVLLGGGPGYRHPYSRLNEDLDKIIKEAFGAEQEVEALKEENGELEEKLLAAKERKERKEIKRLKTEAVQLQWAITQEETRILLLNQQIAVMRQQLLALVVLMACPLSNLSH